MLEFTVPVEPPELPVLMAQAPAKIETATPVKNKTITFCRDIDGLIPDSANNHFSPISVEFLRQIGARHGVTIEELKPYHVTLLTPPQHGEIRLVYEPSHHWSYVPANDYTGADRAIYLVEKQGKRNTAIVNFWVLQAIDENLKAPVCKSIKFSSGDSDQ